jgi:large subunit ribosomal protein L22
MSFSVRATARFIPMSPRKARLVVDAVRGRPVREALAILRFTPKAAARPVTKLMNSAVANARENYGLEPEDLFVAEIAADPGPMLKRGHFGARGRFKPFLKRTCHISVALRELHPEAIQGPGTAGDATAAGD